MDIGSWVKVTLSEILSDPISKNGIPRNTTMPGMPWSWEPSHTKVSASNIPFFCIKWIHELLSNENSVFKILFMVVFSYNPGKIWDTLDEELVLFLKGNINVIIFNFDFSTEVFYIYTTLKQIGIIPIKHLHT